MGRRIEIPKHIDFKPREDIKDCFERERSTVLTMPRSIGEPTNTCDVCGKHYSYRLKVYYENNGKRCRHDF